VAISEVKKSSEREVGRSSSSSSY